jgi:Luciferase-like monooxygenase
VTTAVTCPTVRVHPAILAQAAATAALMLEGRFLFGIGTGENLNEHVLGDRWPRVDTRLEMLEEAVEVMRKLWEGELTSHDGRFYRVENARVYSLPDSPPPVLISALGPKAVSLAARKTAHQLWPNSLLPGQLSQELALPSHFEQASALVTEDQLAEMLPCGPDPERHLESFRQYLDAGFDEVYVSQIGNDQAGFFDFYRRELAPQLS